MAHFHVPRKREKSGLMAAGTDGKKVSVITGITRAPQGPFSGASRNEETRVTRWRKQRGDRRSCYLDTKSRPTRKSARVSQPDVWIREHSSNENKMKTRDARGKKFNQWSSDTLRLGLPLTDSLFLMFRARWRGDEIYEPRTLNEVCEKIVASVEEAVQEEFRATIMRRERERDGFLSMNANK